jgi:uncharacterized membrane protein HdeD (DUF308 family)
MDSSIMRIARERIDDGPGMPARGQARRPGTLAFGALAVALGAAAILLPGGAAPSVALWLGGLLALDGSLRGLRAAQARHRPGFGWELLIASASLAAAGLLLSAPSGDLLTLVVAVFLIVAGIAKGFHALALPPLPGWGGLLGGAATTTALGLALLLLLPGAAPSVAALLVGVTLVWDGSWLAVTPWLPAGGPAGAE